MLWYTCCFNNNHHLVFLLRLFVIWRWIEVSGSAGAAEGSCYAGLCAAREANSAGVPGPGGLRGSRCGGLGEAAWPPARQGAAMVRFCTPAIEKIYTAAYTIEAILDSQTD